MWVHHKLLKLKFGHGKHFNGGVSVCMHYEPQKPTARVVSQRHCSSILNGKEYEMLLINRITIIYYIFLVHYFLKACRKKSTIDIYACFFVA